MTHCKCVGYRFHHVSIDSIERSANEVLQQAVPLSSCPTDTQTNCVVPRRSGRNKKLSAGIRQAATSFHLLGIRLGSESVLQCAGRLQKVCCSCVTQLCLVVTKLRWFIISLAKEYNVCAQIKAKVCPVIWENKVEAWHTKGRNRGWVSLNKHVNTHANLTVLQIRWFLTICHDSFDLIWDEHLLPKLINEILFDSSIIIKNRVDSQSDPVTYD